MPYNMGRLRRALLGSSLTDTLESNVGGGRKLLEQGVGKAELARKLGVSRRTVYRGMETDQLDRD